MKKTIEGHVTQEWDEDKKKFVSQEFSAEDGCSTSYQDDMGEELDEVPEDLRKAYLPMDMVQPSADRIKKWIRTGELDENDLPMTVKGLLEDAGAALDSAYSHEIMGEILFEGEDGRVYVGSVEFVVVEANPDYVKAIEEEDE